MLIPRHARWRFLDQLSENVCSTVRADQKAKNRFPIPMFSLQSKSAVYSGMQQPLAFLPNCRNVTRYTERPTRVVARVESKHRFPTLKFNRSTAGIGSGSRVRQAFTCTPCTVLLRGRVTFARDRGRHNGLPVGLFPTRCSRVTH